MTQPRLFATPQEGSTSDDYYTPKWLFDALGIEFDLDVCCPPEGPLHTPCKAYYTQADDGLTADWHGTVWMNPPFSNLNAWVQKWIKHGDGVCIVPTSRGKWFTALWESSAQITHPKPPNNDVKFVFNGELKSIFMPTMVAAIGKGKLANLEAIGTIR